MSQWQGPDDRDAGSWTTPGPGGPGGPDAPVGPPPGGTAPPTGPQAPAPGWATDPGAPWGRPASAGSPQPGIVPLRPLSLGEIWDGGFRAFRQNPKVMVGLSAIVVGTVSLVQLAASLVTGRDVVGLTNRLEAGSGDAAEVFGTVQRTVPVLLGSTLLQVVAVLVLNGMLIVAVSRAVLGRTIGLGELWAACRRKVLPLIGLSLIVALAGFVVGAVALLPGILVLVTGSGSNGTLALGVGLTLLGLLAWAAGGLWLWVKWSLATPAMLLEGLGVGASLRRSWRLTRRSFWRLLGILLLTSIVVYVVVLAVSAPFTVVGTVVGGVSGATEFGTGYVLSQVLTTVGSLVGSLVGYPFLASVTALLYVDLRMRREGLDVELHRAAAGPGQG